MTQPTPGRATPKEIRDYFGKDSRPVGLQEIKALKDSAGGKDYDDIANGLGNGTMTY